MPPRDTLTGPPHTNWFAVLLGVAIAAALLYGLRWGCAAIVGNLRKPPPANVVRASSRFIVGGLLWLLFAAPVAVYVALVVHVGVDTDDQLIGNGLLVYLGLMGAATLLYGLRWRIVIEKDGIVHRGRFRSRRIRWADIRSTRVLGSGRVFLELRPNGRIVVPEDAQNKEVLVPAVRAARVQTTLDSEWVEEDEDAEK